MQIFISLKSPKQGNFMTFVKRANLQECIGRFSKILFLKNKKCINLKIQHLFENRYFGDKV